MEISGYMLVESNVLAQLTTKEYITSYIEKLQAELGDNTAKVEKLQTILEKLDNGESVSIKLDRNKMYMEGKRTSNEDVDEYIVSITGRCLVTAEVPKVDGDEPTQSYDKFVQISRTIRMTCNDNLDILSHDSFDLVIYEMDITYPVPADALKGMGLINLIDMSDIEYGAIKKVIDTGLEEVKKVELPTLDWENMFKRKGGNYADVYLDPSFSVITNGKVEKEQEVSTTGVTTDKYVWKGEYPLDRLIYTIQSNLDILLLNNKIKGDIYGNLYATLMAQAINSATVLEQARLQAYEQASQFQVKTMVEYYLGAITAKLNVVKTLAEVQTQFLQKSIYQAQIKLYNIQSVGFKSNNSNKLFTSQVEGAATAYSSGMLEYPPAIYNNADMMSFYTDVGTSMSIL